MPPLDAKDIPNLVRKGRLRIAVIGLGRIGLPTAAAFAKAGAKVTGVDLKKDVVEMTNAGECWLTDELGLADLVRDAVRSGNLKATLVAEDAIAKADFSIICVPTPVYETKTPDYSAVQKASRTLGKSLRKGSVVIVESTVGPGIVENMVGPILEDESGLTVGKDFGLVSCPERSDPGNIMQNMKTLPRIVGGIGPSWTNVTVSLYESALGVKAIRVSDPKTANAAKLTENLFRDVNIALANEFALLFEELGVDTIEVINACASKYNFMPHYPGIGVGGPCVIGDEFGFLTNRKGLHVTRLAGFVDELAANRNTTRSRWGATEFFIPGEPIQTLSFDGRRTVFNRVSWFSRRRYEGKIIKVRLTTNRCVAVTPDHPMLIKRGSEIVVRAARDLRPGDEVPVSSSYGPPISLPAEIDLVDELKASGESALIDAKVKPLRSSLREHRDYFLKGLKHIGVPASNRSDYLRNDYLHLDKYITLEKWQPSPISHDEVALYTAEGSAHAIPAVFHLGEEFWRLIGYYVSEGCITESGGERGVRERIKISFRQREKDLIGDCRSILGSWGITPDEEIRDGSHSLRFSSRLFALLLLEVLQCGDDSNTKRVPPQIFFSSRRNIAAFLQGVFRGDGSLENVNGEKSLMKTYATVSPECYQGLLVLLQAFSIVPTCGTLRSKKSTAPAYVMKITGYGDLPTLQQDVGGSSKLALALTTYYRTKSPAFTNYGSYGTAFVRSVQELSYSGNVYNMEVEGAHTFVTSFGVITHNCLPANSYYLISEGIKAGNIPYLIRMAREINDRMPDHAVELVEEALNEAGKTVKGSKIAMLGVAYKPNIKDVQLTPVERVITRLREMGARVEIYDPMFKGEEVFGLRTKPTLEAAARGADCLVIGTAHDEFRHLDVEELSKLVNAKAGFVDGRNVVSPSAVVKAGFAYKGVGRK
jgi:nucleotide sugar dehydrogenase